MSKSSPRPLTELDTFDPKSGDLNVIIETPRGARNKIDYDPELHLFELSKVLPEGSVFPFDFGFMPSTLGDDGDPLDILILLDESLPTGALAKARLIGVIEAEQTSHGKTVRNDRFLSVPIHAHTHAHVKSYKDLRPALIDEIQHFFASYNQQEGGEFKPLACKGPNRAQELVNEGIEKFKNNKK